MAVLAVALLLGVFLLVKPVPQQTVMAVDDIADILAIMGPLVLLIWCWGRAHRKIRLRDRHVRASLLLAAGTASFVVGECIWSYYELIAHQPPFPSWADAGYLCSYPLLLLGILQLPGSSGSVHRRWRAVLDSMLILTGIVTFSWYFVLGPTLFTAEGSIFARAVGTAYPAFDLVLVVSLLFLWSRSRDVSIWPAALVTAALAIIVVTDSLFDYQSLHGLYASGNLLDDGWTLGYMLMGLGAVATFLTPDRPHAEAPLETAARSRRWLSLAPYVLVPAVVTLVLYTIHHRGDEILEPGVYVGGAMLLILLMVRQALVILENERLYQATVAHAAELAKLATMDALTGLPNHRATVAALDQEIERSRRYNRPCSVIFLDIDHFKQINDRHGHLTGDAVLRHFGTLVREALRAIDLLGRWGGEEFVAILPETTRDEAMMVAERLRSAVAAHGLIDPMPSHLTCSLGVASYPLDAEERDALLRAADEALYSAKRLGRNQVRSAGDMSLWVESPEQAGRHIGIAGTVEAMAALVAARDRYTSHHSDVVGMLAARLARRLNLAPALIEQTRIAACLHDIGKVAVPDAVLLKPGRLTDEEWVLMRAHPDVGADVLLRVPDLAPIAPIIRAHHERWDGGGYPDGRSGQEIPIAARIITVVDAYAAMRSDRPYRAARPVAESLAELRRCAGTQFDPRVVDAFVALLQEESAPSPEGSEVSSRQGTI